jgi:hypothetical protein
MKAFGLCCGDAGHERPQNQPATKGSFAGIAERDKLDMPLSPGRSDKKDGRSTV